MEINYFQLIFTVLRNSSIYTGKAERMNSEEFKEREAYVDECFSLIKSQVGVENVLVMNENCK